MITLYHAPRSRSSMILWLLEELGQPYKIELVPIVYGDGHGTSAPESYRDIHPHKKVPAIDHEGSVVFECAGIAAYVADTFSDAKLAPPVGDPKRGLYASLLAYWAGAVNPIAWAHSAGWDKDKPTGFGTFEDMDAFVSRIVGAADPWIFGKQLTVADVLYGSAVNYFMMTGAFPKHQVYADYAARINDRPASKAAFAKDNG